MLLNAGFGKLGNQPSRSRLRIFLFAAVGILGVIFIWTTSGTGGRDITNAMKSWPAAVASKFSPDGDSSGADSGANSGNKYKEPMPPPAEATTKSTTGEVKETTPETTNTTSTTTTTVPPLFILVGDSTTCGPANNGGGWGDAFIWVLTRGAEGANYGVNGALSTGYFHSPMWEDAMNKVRSSAPERKVYVTIQFGHNDQMPGSNVTLDLYQAALVGMARDVLTAGGTPVLVTPLARRDFEPDGTTVVDNLIDYREATLRAHKEVLDGQPDGDRSPNRARVINLNAASLAYIGAIGKTASFRYNKFHPFFPDTTHLNELGAIVFARIVADLMLGHPPALIPSGEKDPWSPGGDNKDDEMSGWIAPDPYLTSLIWHGDSI